MFCEPQWSKGLVRSVADSDRLQQLRRQRAAIAEHLAWLDREIRREAKLPTSTGGDEVPLPTQTTPPAAPQPAATPTVPTKLKLATPVPETTTAPVQLEANNPSPALTADPDAVLEEWTEQTGPSDQPISKTGCWAIFIALGVIIIGGSVTAIYLIYS